MLFPPELIEQTESRETPVESSEKSSESVARSFVRWCWNLGGDFHNSPDITNFRFWSGKERVRFTPSDEEEILSNARRLFLKKVEQAVRKADVLKDKD